MRKGFTLVELLTAIVILSLIVLLVYPMIMSVINDSRKSAYESQISLVEKAAKKWGVENVSLLPSECSIPYDIQISDLISSGYISGRVINGEEVIENPMKRGTGLKGFVRVTYECSGTGKYVYKYMESD